MPIELKVSQHHLESPTEMVLAEGTKSTFNQENAGISTCFTRQERLIQPTTSPTRKEQDTPSGDFGHPSESEVKLEATSLLRTL
jgi:hypothetical protein